MTIRILALATLLASTCYAAPDKVQYELQERCGKTCKDAFEREWGRNGVVNNDDGQMRATYQNHYSVRLNKCFYLEEVTTYPINKTQSVHEDQVLYDINENKQYGNFHRMYNYVGPYGDIPPATCYVLDKPCRSKNEWDALVRPYMEE